MDEQIVDDFNIAREFVERLTAAHSLLVRIDSKKVRSKATYAMVLQATQNIEALQSLLASETPLPNSDSRLLQAERRLDEMRAECEAVRRQVEAAHAIEVTLRAELAEAHEGISALTQDLDDAFAAQQAAKAQIAELRTRLAHLESALTNAQSTEAQLASLREQYEAIQTDLCACTQEREAYQQSLVTLTTQLDAERAEHDRVLAEREAELEQLKAALARAATDREIAFRERNAAVEELQHKERDVKLQTARQLGSLLVILAELAEREPSLQRRPFETLKRLIRDLVGGILLESFPSSNPGELITLSVERESMESLLAQYDWQPAQPFAGARTECQFRLVTHGWRAGDLVLAKAVLAPISDTPIYPG